MKITIELELEQIEWGFENDRSPLPDEIIREKVAIHLRYACSRILDEVDSDVWIDISDDGDGKYNVYRIKTIS